jgi:hypothetical protein
MLELSCFYPTHLIDRCQPHFPLLVALHSIRLAGSYLPIFIAAQSSHSLSLVLPHLSRFCSPCSEDSCVLVILRSIAMTLTSSSMALAWAFYATQALLLTIICHRRFFQPLYAIPGPFLPAVTRLYLWYYHIVKDGSYYKVIDEMHTKYGTRATSSLVESPSLTRCRTNRSNCTE